LLSQAFEDQHFRKFEIFSRPIQTRLVRRGREALPTRIDLPSRIETEQENDQGKNDRRQAHG